MNQRDIETEIHTLSMKIRIQGVALREILKGLPKRRAAEYAKRLQASLEQKLLDVDNGPMSDESDQAVAVELAELLSIVSAADS
jgi:23S rRNA pseudoU1915 N3-methylase RlmH